MAANIEDDLMKRLTVMDGGQVVGSALAQKLSWDTDFFGLPCGRLESFQAGGDNQTRYHRALELARQALAWAGDNRIRFMVVKIPGPDPLLVQALERTGFYLTDNTMSLALTGPAPENRTPLPVDFQLVDQPPDNPEKTADFFARLFTDGRFHNDRRIQRAKADELWRRAAVTQLSGEASHVLFLMHQGSPAGLATIKAVDPPPSEPQTRTGCLFILGVNEKFRGQGLGGILLVEALKRARDAYDRLEVETSVFNKPALNLYQAAGFVMNDVKVSLHYWADQDINA